jgi:hypothetical protein
MIATADKKRRVVLPLPANPGDVFDVARTPTGFQLVKLEKTPPPKARIVTRNGRKLLTNDRVMTMDDFQRIQADIDAEDARRAMGL